MMWRHLDGVHSCIDSIIVVNSLIFQYSGIGSFDDGVHGFSWRSTHCCMCLCGHCGFAVGLVLVRSSRCCGFGEIVDNADGNVTIESEA